MKTIALDMSPSKIGWAIGEPGKPEKFGTLKKPKEKLSDIELFHLYAHTIAEMASREAVELCVAEDWVRGPSATQMLRSGMLRGAVAVLLKDRLNVESIYFPPNEWRKAAGVNLKDLPRNGKRDELKQRAIGRCQMVHKIDPKTDDEAEAYLLLVGVAKLLEIGD